MATTTEGYKEKGNHKKNRNHKAPPRAKSGRSCSTTFPNGIRRGEHVPETKKN